MSVERTIAAVISDLLSESNAQFRNELRVAQAQMFERMRSLRASLVAFGFGAALLAAALVIFLEAAVAGLITAGFGLVLSTLLVGGATLIIAIVVLGIGFGRSRRERPAAKRSDLRQE